VGHHDREWASTARARRSLAQGEEQIDHSGEFIHVGNVDLQQDVLLARNSMALHHLRGPLSLLEDRPDLTWAGPNSDVGSQGEPESGWVQLEAIAGDHPGGLQSLEALCHSRGRQLDPARQFSNWNPRVVDQGLQELNVDGIQHCAWTPQTV
jgi:hypothetical protein